MPAIKFSAFLLPMLEPEPKSRAQAIQMLSHPWLFEIDLENIRLSDEEYQNVTCNIRNEDPYYIKYIQQVIEEY